MATTAEAFENAFAHHRAGRIAEAAVLYRQVLESEPRHVDALHLMGVAAHQSGQHEAAVQYIARAIALRGGDQAFHANLGEVYLALDRLDEAERCYAQALRLDSNVPQTHLRLGDVQRRRGRLPEAAAAYQEALRRQPNFPDALDKLGVVLGESGDSAGAIARFEQAIEFDPAFTRAYENLATTLVGQGRGAEAIDCYRRAMQRNPGASQFHFGLGVLYHNARQFEEAAASYREVLRLNPRMAIAHVNLGTALKELGRFDEVLTCYREALAIDPNLAAAHYNIGLAARDQGQIEEAMRAYRETLRLEPDHIKALVNYGNLLERQGQLDEALARYRRVVQVQPELPLGHFSCANVYRTKKTPAEAIAAYQEAIRLKPDYGDAYNNLAVIYIDLMQPDAAEKCCRKGLECAPKQAALYSNLATALLLEGRLDEALEARRQAVSMRPDNPSEHSNLVYDMNFVPAMPPETIFAEHLEWAKRHAEPLASQAAPHSGDRDPNRRIRVGYVSAFFRTHAVNYFTEPILVAHDHGEFEVYCYSDVLQPDEATQRIKAAVDVWRDVYAMSDAELAEVVRRDKIDILVDLTGHIGTNRLPLFARKPAPVQVTYIGYQNTTGMSAMDYRLTDAHADPPGETDRYYTEKLVRLPRAFFCYRPPDDSPDVTPLGALGQGHVTFGSFNKFVKVTLPVIEAWLRILARVPEARLFVLAHRGGFAQNRLHVAAASKGIDPTRIELFDRQGHVDYMKLVARTDIALDPFPFNGHTTTCDALWMGVPVVTLAGAMYASRYGGSALVNLGLESWIARSVDEYVDIAARAAGDLDALARLRAELRPRMADSPLLDFAGFTRNLETAYRQMWRTWCADGS